MTRNLLNSVKKSLSTIATVLFIYLVIYFKSLFSILISISDFSTIINLDFLYKGLDTKVKLTKDKK